MRIEWFELDAVKIADPYIKVLFPIMESENGVELAAGMKEYTDLPEEVQCALGYVSCLLESEADESYSAWDQYCTDIMQKYFEHVPLMRLPLRFIGWAGKENEIGPAYEIDGTCHIRKESRIFYTDDDIQDSADKAEELAKDIAQASSGIADVRTEQLAQLRMMDRDSESACWCVTFRLDETSRREADINGKPAFPENGRAFFILPKAGEFECMLGEMVKSDPDNAFVLAIHNYCMK